MAPAAATVQRDTAHQVAAVRPVVEVLPAVAKVPVVVLRAGEFVGRDVHEAPAAAMARRAVLTVQPVVRTVLTAPQRRILSQLILTSQRLQLTLATPTWY